MGYDMVVQGAPNDEPNTYLRRTIMAPTVQALVSLGMAFRSELPHFPESDHLSGDDFDDHGAPVTERAQLYMQALERTRTDHGAGDADNLGGIPTHKFSSTDQWHVTDKECVQALAAYEVSIQNGETHPEALGDDVIPFLRTAAKYAGFRVY